MSDFDKKYNIVDENTPPNTLLSAHYKKSFAYYTLRERLPIILTQVVDNLSKDKDQIAQDFSEEVREELKEIVGEISKLKYELQTDKPITPFNLCTPDKEMWNDFVNSMDPKHNSYFTTCWLYAECYMYRRLKVIFEGSSYLKDFDYFRKQKENALTGNIEVLATVVQRVREFPNNQDKGNFLRKLVKLNLWGNRCDLSISEGKEIKHTEDPFNAIDSLDEYILVNDTEDIWNCISSLTGKEKIIEFINDNAGYEIFTDFLIAEFLIEQKLATKVRFNVKAIPWFISDLTSYDFYWTIDYLRKGDSEILKSVGDKWIEYLDNGKFELVEDNYFWTSPYEFYRMPEICEPLYKKLSEANLLIFKGDLNYRKLIGDFSWDFTTDFKTCLRGFLPTNLCVLRTVKADLICGLKAGEAEALTKKDPTWMITAKYGVIQFAGKK